MISYEPNHKLCPGESITLPSSFIGVYKNTGYKCRKSLHWTPRIISTEQVEMDWAEVRIMQEVMRDHLPKEQTKWDGYYIWLNSWWANEDLRGKINEAESAKFRALADKVMRTKCIDFMLIAPVWLGWTEFIGPAPEIDAIGDNAEFPLNESIQKLLDHCKNIGLELYGFCEPNSLNRHYRQDRPDFRVQPNENSEDKLIQNCHANIEYENWFYRLTVNTIDKCNLVAWAWDHSWMRRPAYCYAESHSHEPGNCEFDQYNNITNMIAKLRKRYPKLFMEIYWGLKEGGPWSLRGLNSLENAYENGSPPPPDMSFADDMRFQHWYNHNYRFIPTYMNLAQLNFKKESNGTLYSILSCLGSSSHASLADWIDFNTDKEADDIFGIVRKWKDWASENLKYLNDRIDIFGQPCRKDGIDGSTHIIKDRGFIFVFNPTPDIHWGSITLNEMIGFTGGNRFEITEISTGERKKIAVCKMGDDFIFPIEAKTALLFELKPVKSAKLSMPKAPADVKIQPAFEK